jgi:8-oxo-dGTP pyrophosphatase MutT (NUDIX family)
MPDGPGKWVCPSGYLDYDEDGWDAMRRETYEETSFLFDDYKKYLIFDNDKEPFYTHTKPNENRQNILIWYCVIFDFSSIGLPKNIESYKNYEVDKVKWLPIEHIKKYEWGFKHDERIRRAIDTHIY